MNMKMGHASCMEYVAVGEWGTSGLLDQAGGAIDDAYVVPAGHQRSAVGGWVPQSVIVPGAIQ
jgi:hypothetical protein